MKKLLGIVVLGLLLCTNAFALVCHPSYKFHPPEIPDPDELLGKFPIMKPYKPKTEQQTTLMNHFFIMF